MSIFQIVTKASWDSVEQFRNVHHYEFAGYVPDTSQLQEAVDELDAGYKTNLQGHFVNEVQVYGYDVRRVDLGNQPAVEYEPTAGAWNGTVTGNPLPSQISPLVTFKALSTFPRTTRTYLFPVSNADGSTKGTPTQTLLDSMEAWADDILELDITGGLNADKTAVKYGGSPRAVTDNNEVTVIKCAEVFATQRRRKLGVGI